MSNIIKFPKNLKALKGASEFRNYCLNPKGIQVWTCFGNRPYSDLLYEIS